MKLIIYQSGKSSLDSRYGFTDSVNMNTLVANFLASMERVVHVAYGCGCLRTFHVERNHTPRTRCETHDSEQISFTEELVPRQAA